jgi:CheY-like chemotaxis protein
MESIGRLAGGVAHDFNNMLSVIVGYAELVLGMPALDPSLEPDIREIHQAAQRSANLTRQLLAFARKQNIEPQVLDLNETLAGMLKMLGRLIGEDIDLRWLPGENTWPVQMDPSQIDQILANLCVNARDAIEDGGRITIETDNAVFDREYCAEHPWAVPGDYALLAVSDDGSGMDKETMAKLFEPFFTTKELGKGTGLGLATVYGIVKQNNGFINVYSEPGQGTTFRIYLPRHLAGVERPRKERRGESLLRGSEHILLVEDEPAILRMATQMLERQGYTVSTAGTPSEAIRIANEEGRGIHLLITDVVMPEMNGRELALQLREQHPSLRVLFMSGYMANMLVLRSLLDDGAVFIGKPFSISQLGRKVRAALEPGD